MTRRANLKVVGGSSIGGKQGLDLYRVWINSADWIQAQGSPLKDRFIHQFDGMVTRSAGHWTGFTAAEHSALRQAGNALCLNPSNRRRAKIDASNASFDRKSPPSVLTEAQIEVWNDTFVNGMDWLHISDTFLAVQYCILQESFKAINYDFIVFTEKRSQQIDAIETSLGLNARGQRLLGVEIGGENSDRGILD